MKKGGCLWIQRQSIVEDTEEMVVLQSGLVDRHSNVLKLISFF